MTVAWTSDTGWPTWFNHIIGTTVMVLAGNAAHGPRHAALYMAAKGTDAERGHLKALARTYATMRSSFGDSENIDAMILGMARRVKEGAFKTQWADGAGTDGGLDAAQLFNWFTYQVFFKSPAAEINRAVLQQAASEIEKAALARRKAFMETSAWYERTMGEDPLWADAVKAAEAELEADAKEAAAVRLEARRRKALETLLATSADKTINVIKPLSEDASNRVRAPLEIRPEPGRRADLGAKDEAKFADAVRRSEGLSSNPAHYNQVRMRWVVPAAVSEEARGIHDENLSRVPEIPERTIICHIIAESILPVTQAREGILNRLESKMRSDNFSEKIVALSGAAGEAAAFMRELERIRAREEGRYKGYKVIFDVACPDKDWVGMVQRSGMKALAFTAEGEGDIVQVEGIILALRALQDEKASVKDLVGVYKLLSGKDYQTALTDIDELARTLEFVLPARKIDVDRIGVINRIIEEKIKSAA
jgi:hypothetical protein